MRATFEPLTGPKGLREPEATLEPRVHEYVRHSSQLYWAQVYLSLYLSLSFVFACLTPHNIVIEFLVPRAFQKYNACLVYSDFPIPGKNSPLEGGGGPNTYCKFYPNALWFKYSKLSADLLLFSVGPASL